MKSQAECLLHVAEGIRKDISLAYPALQSSLSKDFDRLALYCRTRGLAFFTLDLPNLDSILIDGLEVGRLSLSGPVSRPVSGKVKVPRLFSGLWLRVFDKCACLRQDVDVNAVFFLRVLCNLGKKIAVECSNSRRQATVRAYHDIEWRLRPPTLNWAGDGRLDDYEDSRCRHLGDYSYQPREVLGLFTGGALQEELPIEEKKEDLGLYRLLDQVQRVADLFSESFGIYDPLWYSTNLESSSMGIGFRHGTGAVSERIPRTRRTEEWTWPNKLEVIFRHHFHGKTVGADVERPINHEPPSRLMAVPKTAKRPRLIASEPTSHMWAQQGLLSWLEDRIKTCIGLDFIDLKDQSKSGDLVLSASLDRKLATVDLSDASDRLSCWTVERVFRGNPSLLNALHAARTRYIRDEISDVTDFLRLKKFAAQGTAVTFPVQSIVFLSIALGVCLDGEVSWRKIRDLRGSVRVYGDDIIIPRYGYERLCRVMDYLQLKVNRTKSFVNGYFRESCGVDGFKGYDVTPVKPKTFVADSPASRQAVLDTSNNLFNKGLFYASDRMLSLLPARLRRGIRIVGKLRAGSPGLTSFVGSDESHLIKRWNQRLHRTEVRVWSTRARTRKETREGWSTLLDFFASKYSHEQARTVSEYVDTRKASDGFSWEPSSQCP
ncbi:TPA_asm: RNA-directed RNA polymerase [ssRNA phage Gerhypos.4_14]|uniref:RNA-directed RNA polymerase n=2 Tax=Leviviricetes TaxID=2842243 RepID=A0A8S5L3I5_9VIRU|nr:RNA-directed RNA polymerase [ssRNA phage Gerhypos.4_14]QDH87945.1 MAG: RNA-dependent RNA polymerase [Leviviridae sp.]DAD51980.1 TPA_asm: RNA-directed RNA polymerase [ssRNA phage Gerhypos.4_14]